uniref:Transcription factor TFIIIB component B'' Myb domain-containing protein n=1 Tax=Corethron hystrix TaxID=216773 RepID=A0A7S1BLM4_9STRA|mmetsp:Transcript_31329/g.71652  ORF Transcript_31329/g.71652 Transcript_31329/m.71652 type:complete len:512 (+) Transcript_31329:621-2156(+)
MKIMQPSSTNRTRLAALAGAGRVLPGRIRRPGAAASVVGTGRRAMPPPASRIISPGASSAGASAVARPQLGAVLDESSPSSLTSLKRSDSQLATLEVGAIVNSDVRGTDSGPVSKDNPSESSSPVLADFCTSYRSKRSANKRQKGGANSTPLKLAAFSAALPDEASVAAEEPDTPGPVAVTAPTVEIDEEGNIVVNAASLTVDGAAHRRARGRRNLEDSELDAADAAEGFTEVVEENSGQLTATYTSFRETGPHSKKYSNPQDKWSDELTKRFYWALRRCGTDFSAMVRVLDIGRTRKQMKAKYLREEKQNPTLIDLVLDPSRQLPTDISLYGITVQDVEQVTIDKAAAVARLEEEAKLLREMKEKKKKKDDEKKKEPDDIRSICSNADGVESGELLNSPSKFTPTDPNDDISFGNKDWKDAEISPSDPFALDTEDGASALAEDASVSSSVNPDLFFMEEKEVPQPVPVMRGGGGAGKKNKNKFQAKARPRPKPGGAKGEKRKLIGAKRSR